MIDADSRVPVPDAARFRRRDQERPRVTFTTDPNTWVSLDEEGWAGLPHETRRTVEWPPGSDMFCTLVKSGRDGSWSLLARHGLHPRHLAGVRSAARVPIDPERTNR